MEEPKLKNAALIKEELDRSSAEAGECEKLVQRLNQELQEAQEHANSGKHKCLELQGLLEEEKKSSKQQSEESAKLKKVLQDQVQKLQEEMELLRDQKDSAIFTMRQEREHEVSALTGNLATLTSELEKWQQTASGYERQLDSARVTHQQQNQAAKQQATELERLRKDCESLRKECVSLRAEQKQMTDRQQSECGHLRSEKEQLLKKLQLLEEDLESWRKQSCELSSTVRSLEKRLSDLQDQQQQQDNSRIKQLQKEYEDSQTELSGLREKFEKVEEEKRSVVLDLQQSLERLRLLQDNNNHHGNWHRWMPVAAVTVAVAAYLLAKTSK